MTTPDQAPHDSGLKHAAGAARYIDDLPEPPGTLHVSIASSPHARATAQADLSAVRAAPGVVVVLTADDIPGVNDCGPVVHDEPLLAFGDAGGEVFCEGQALFAVAADTPEQARAAASLARIDWTPQDAILTIDDAIDAESYISEPYRMAKGDAAAAIAAAPNKVCGQIDIGGQEHFYLEGQIAFATPGEDDDMLVYSSTQHPSETQEIIAHALSVPNHAVTVEARRLGGAFGGKETQANGPAALAALAARATGRPCKLRLDRDDDMRMTGKRHPFRILYEAGYDAEGRILGARFTQYADCGWSTDLSNAICDRAMFHADNAYYYPACEITSYRLRTHTASNTAFRGFGGPQGMLGAEALIEDIAAATGLDPLIVRRRNFYAPVERFQEKWAPVFRPETRQNENFAQAPQTTPYHMRVEDSVIDQIVDELAETADYAARRTEIADWNAQSLVLKRGLALTPVKFGISFTTSHLNQAGALVNVYKDGSILINHGGIEMGQGLYTKVAGVAARAFGLPMARIKTAATRTDKVPNTSATAASSGADMNGMAVRISCETLKARLIDFMADQWGADTDSVRFTDGAVTFATRDGAQTRAFNDLIHAAYLARVSLSATGFYKTPKIWWDRAAARGRPFLYFAYGAAISEVILDPLTGENRLLRVDILHDVGKSLNPALDIGQIEGGFMQGVGWLTSEEVWRDGAGRLKTHAPSTYKIPACGDRPRAFNAHIWSKGENREFTIRRSKAVGEPPLMLGISAFTALRAACAACGPHAPLLDAPATPERLMFACARAAG